VLVQPAERRFTPQPPPRVVPLDSRGEQVPTVLEALLPITSDVAFNALLNMQQPEGVVLLRSFDDVPRLIFAHAAPYARAFTPDGTSHFRRGKTTASEPSITSRRGASLLCGGTDDQQTIAQHAARQQQAAVHAAAHAKQAAEKDTADQQASTAAAKAHSQAAQQANTLERKVRHLAGELEAARDERATSAPAAALRDAHAELDAANAQLSSATADEARHAAEVERLGGLVRNVLTRLEHAQRDEASLAKDVDGKENCANDDDASRLQSKATDAQRAAAAAEKARAAVRGREEEVAKRAAAVAQSEASVREQFPDGPPSDLATTLDDRTDGTADSSADGGAEGSGRGGGASRTRALSERAAGKQAVGRAPPEAAADAGSGAAGGEAQSAAAVAEWARKEEEEAKKVLNSLVAKLRTADRKCGGSDANGASAEQLKADEARAKRALEAHDTVAVQCEALYEKLGPALKERVRFWRASQKKAGAQSSDDFNRCLSYKGLAGALEHDHEKEELHALVYTSSQDQHAHASRSLRSLSGGEQAFAALCFALSMWPFSASPLRAMDEFDKNMDQTFLQASLKHLLEAAETAPTRQILILTPNDYHASLTGPVCKPIYSRLMGGCAVDDYDAPIQIKHMPEVDRS
jgi:DNA repair exonuclease SbcCD ATPase subunit